MKRLFTLLKMIYIFRSEIVKEINSSKKNNIIRGVRGGWMHGPPGRRGLFNITSGDLLKKTPRILDFGGSTLKKFRILKQHFISIVSNLITLLNSFDFV